jgi:glyoxylase-like metal-dependent hydrolase (beta-lactamase superfamily II)
MPELVVERIEIPAFVGNSYVVGFPGGPCAFIDAGADAAKMTEAAARHGMTPAAVLLTHHHYDHVSELEEILDRIGRVDVLIHEFEQPLASEFVTGFTANIEDGETIRIGDDLEFRAVATPGHTQGMLSFLGHGHVFTGDTLFRESVAGVRAPGHTTFEDLRSSIMDTLLDLPDETVVVSGHAAPTTIGHEREHNPFVRVWRGLDEEGDEPVIVSLPDDDGETRDHEVRLVLEAADYDGGTKCWIRWPDGADDLVPGSKVRRP